MMLILSLLIFLPKLLCGFALVHWFWEEWDISSIVIKIGIGFALGLALSSSLFFFSMIIGVSPKLYSLIEFWGSLGYAILILLNLLPQIKINWKFAIFTWQEFLTTIILLAGSGLLIYAFVLYSKMHPYGFEDAWSIWNFTARLLYRTNSTAILFNNQIYDPFHPDYPVGLGLNVAWGWFVLGRESTNVPIAIAFYVIASPALMLWGALKKWRGTLPAILGTLVYLMNPNLKWSVGQMADGLLALYMLAAMIMLYGYLRLSKPGLLLMAGLLSGCSAWIKNEGVLFIGVFLLISAIMMWKQVIPKWNIKWIGLGMSLPILIVTVYKFSIYTSTEYIRNANFVTAQLIDIQRWQTIGREFLVNFLHYGDWPISIVIILVVYMTLVGLDHSERQSQIWLLLLLLGQFVGYFFIYLITPYDLNWQLSTSVDRLVSHLFPMLFFWMFIALQPPLLASSRETITSPSS